ncbi:hypothetical protein [Amycolatopsis dongchuanensis]|uniref:Lipoprotein n=1 Tax=Amycolatopsis dongchuanensis TaxID=1070866 RepID=A0ABP9QYK0_9PSEU
MAAPPRPILTLFIGALLALTTACTSTSKISGNQGDAPGAASTPGVTGYLYSDSNVILFLQWPTAKTGAVQGTIKDDYVNGDAPNEKVEDRSEDFTGQVNQDGSATFNFPGWWGSVYGNQAGDTLNLNFPQQNGGFKATTFHRATPTDYNSALANFRQAVNQINQGVIQQQAQHQKQATDRERTTCSQVGGTWTGDNTASPNCEVTYKDRDGYTKTFDVSFDPDGNVRPQNWGPSTPGGCAMQIFPGKWHTDTDICW